jgi:hypothetical protein
MDTMVKAKQKESPVENWGEEFRDQILIVGLELLSVDGFGGFAVEIVRVESFDSLENLHVLFIGQVGVSTFPVPRVEAVVADHREGLGGQSTLILENVVEILNANHPLI